MNAQTAHPSVVSADHRGRCKRRGSRLPAAGLLILTLLFAAAAAAPARAASSEFPTVSVRVKDQPLGEVLADLERKTGYAITVTQEWKDHPIEVGFQDRPLDRALKSILADFNHAIFFGPGRQIKIAIYTLKEYGGDADGAPVYVPPEPPPPEPPPEEPQRYDEEQGASEEPMPDEQADMPTEAPAESGEDAVEPRPGETGQGEAGEGENTPGGQEPDLPPEQSD